MWRQLIDHCHLDFYREFQEHRNVFGEDWSPMIRCIKHLQAQDFPTDLFAYTSHACFQITTAPSHNVCEGHRCIGIIWSPRDNLFSLYFWKMGGLSAHFQECLFKCTEEDIQSDLASLITKLFD
jgi:hypothetical protein